MTLTEFLAARYDEREALAREVQAALDGGWNYFDEIPTTLIDPARVLRQVEAGRKILREYKAVLLIERTDADKSALHYREWTVRTLAAEFADHPAYQQEWSPA